MTRPLITVLVVASVSGCVAGSTGDTAAASFAQERVYLQGVMALNSHEEGTDRFEFRVAPVALRAEEPLMERMNAVIDGAKAAKLVRVKTWTVDVIDYDEGEALALEKCGKSLCFRVSLTTKQVLEQLSVRMGAVNKFAFVLTSEDGTEALVFPTMIVSLHYRYSNPNAKEDMDAVKASRPDLVQFIPIAGWTSNTFVTAEADVTKGAFRVGGSPRTKTLLHFDDDSGIPDTLALTGEIDGAKLLAYAARSGGVDVTQTMSIEELGKEWVFTSRSTLDMDLGVPPLNAPATDPTIPEVVLDESEVGVGPSASAPANCPD